MQRQQPKLRSESRAKAIVGAVVALIAIAFVTTAIVTSSPRVCALCHARQSDSLAKGSHSSQDCYSCHLQNGAWGFAQQKANEWDSMYTLALLGEGLSGPAVPVARGNCIPCHGAILDTVIAAKGIRIAHSTCAKDSSCDGCHSSVAHPKAVRWQAGPTMDECMTCHEKGAGKECSVCHIGGTDAVRTSGGPWQTTHGVNWEKTHGMGGASTCDACHKDDFCERCHDVPVPHPVDFGATHGTWAAKDPASCARCHPSQTDFCNPCHGMAMPHPAGFTRAHVKIAKSDNDKKCLRCHVREDCTGCHESHAHPGGATGVPVPWTSTDEKFRP